MSFWNVIVGTSGSCGRLMDGMPASSSGRLNVGRLCGEPREGGSSTAPRVMPFGSESGIALLSSFSSISSAVQPDWKLTMGLPGLSLTAVGVGRFELRSFRFILVAARISSALISMPSFILGLDSASTGSSIGWVGVVGRELFVV